MLSRLILIHSKLHPKVPYRALSTRGNPNAYAESAGQYLPAFEPPQSVTCLNHTSDQSMAYLVASQSVIQLLQLKFHAMVLCLCLNDNHAYARLRHLNQAKSPYHHGLDRHEYVHLGQFYPQQGVQSLCVRSSLRYHLSHASHRIECCEFHGLCR